MSRQPEGKGQKVRFMIGKALAQKWGVSIGKGAGDRVESSSAERKLVFQPLPIAVRLDIYLPVGEKGGVPASQLYWATQDKEGGTEKALELLLLWN